MAIFYTDSASFNDLKVSGSTVMSASNANIPLTIYGSGSTLVSVSGSIGEVLNVSDNFSDTNLFSVSSGSTKLFEVLSTKDTLVSGSFYVTESVYFRGLTTQSQNYVVTINSVTGKLYYTGSNNVGATSNLDGIITTGSNGASQSITGSLTISGSLYLTASTESNKSHVITYETSSGKMFYAKYDLQRATDNGSGSSNDIFSEKSFSVKPSYVSTWTTKLGMSGDGNTAEGYISLRENSNGSGFTTTLKPANLTTDRTITIPDKAGTMVMTVNNTAADPNGNVTITTGTGANPAGSDMEIQYNNGGTAFGASTYFKYIHTSQSLQQGSLTDARGTYSHAEGQQAKSIGSYSHAEGYQTQASGSHSHAEGRETGATGSWSHAEGLRSKAIGNYSHAEGVDCIAEGIYSHAEGSGNLSYANSSHAEGGQTTASGEYSHAEGTYTKAIGYSSHAEGYFSISSASYSHAGGYHTIASASYGTTLGRFNLHNNATSLFVIGDGSSDVSRHDLMRCEIGYVYVTGSLIVTGSTRTSYLEVGNAGGNYADISTLGLHFNPGLGQDHSKIVSDGYGMRYYVRQNGHYHSFMESVSGKSVVTIGCFSDLGNTNKSYVFAVYDTGSAVTFPGNTMFKVLTDKSVTLGDHGELSSYGYRFGVSGSNSLGSMNVDNTLYVTGSRIGISKTSPTARLHIAASTTAAAVMRLDVGPAPTSPNDGDIWLESNDLNGLKIRLNGTTYKVSLTT